MHVLFSASFLQFTFGNLFTILVMAGLGTAGFYRLKGIRNEELQQTSTFWRQQAETLTDRAAALTAERDEQRAAKHELKTQLATEMMKRDLTVVIKQMTDMQQTVLGRIEKSERTSVEFAAAAETRMQTRFETWEAHQELLGETMRGLLSGLSDLNKEIKRSGGR